MSKFLLIAAAGAGYVLGTRAGRERYEQIKSVASKTRTNLPFGSDNGRVPAYSADVAPETDLKPHHI